MNLIVCLDNKNGMLFNGRRQSADRILIQHLLTFVGEGCLWVHPDSASLFGEIPANILVDPDCFSKAAQGDFCFGESAGCLKQLSRAVSIIVYRWNRTYPADLRFPESELHCRTICHTEEFRGYSHEKITQEVYRL